MRRLALFAAALALACSSGKDDPPTPDTTPPAVPVVLEPAQDATLGPSDLILGEVVLAGTAEAGATVEIQLGAQSVGSAVASAAGAWSRSFPLVDGAHTVRVRALDAAGNASAWSAPVSFWLDTARLAAPIPAGSTAPVTSWGQSVPVTSNDASGLGAAFPGQANTWVLAPDFSLGTGLGLNYASALVLFTGTPTGLTHGDLLDDVTGGLLEAFPGAAGPIAASEAVFLTPLFDAADGVVTAAAAPGIPGAPAITGTSGYLNGTSDSRLSRTLALTPGATYTFGWTHQAVLLGGTLAGGAAPSYQVVLRDPATGAALGAPLFSSATDVGRETRSVTRSGLPAAVVLSFELRSASPGYAELDDLTLADGAGPVALANPGFEEGLAAWQTNDPAESQNVRSGARDVGASGSALRITRTFYAPPASPWGRMVDVFENTAASDVTTSAVYLTTLWGSSPLAAVTQAGAAVVGWDAAATVRDAGIVLGTGTALVADADPFVFVVHELTVPAGGKVALVHFVVQLGEADGGATLAEVPPATDAACGAIAAGFPAQEAYRVDLEPGVRALVANF